MNKNCLFACLSAATLIATAAYGAEPIIQAASLSPQEITSHTRLERELAAVMALRTYDAGTRRALEAVARYPNRSEARNARLHGKVTVEFQIDRKGALQEAEIVETSRSRLLDAAALSTVRFANYQALPAELLPGETGRRYRMTFEYRAPPLE